MPTPVDLPILLVPSPTDLSVLAYSAPIDSSILTSPTRINESRHVIPSLTDSPFHFASTPIDCPVRVASALIDMPTRLASRLHDQPCLAYPPHFASTRRIVSAQVLSTCPVHPARLLRQAHSDLPASYRLVVPLCTCPIPSTSQFRPVHINKPSHFIPSLFNKPVQNLPSRTLSTRPIGSVLLTSTFLFSSRPIDPHRQARFFSLQALSTVHVPSGLYYSTRPSRVKPPPTDKPNLLWPLRHLISCLAAPHRQAYPDLPAPYRRFTPDQSRPIIHSQ